MTSPPSAGFSANSMVRSSGVVMPVISFAFLSVKAFTPETMGTVKLETERTDVNIIDAAGRGTSEGLMLALNVGAMLISFLLGPWFIRTLRRLSVGQNIRELGPQAHQIKAGTPTMGGLLILLSITVPFLILSEYRAVSMAVLGVALASGALGFIDDWTKVAHRRSLGLSGRWKLLAQALIAIAEEDGGQGSGHGLAEGEESHGCGLSWRCGRHDRGRRTCPSRGLTLCVPCEPSWVGTERAEYFELVRQLRVLTAEGERGGRVADRRGDVDVGRLEFHRVARGDHRLGLHVDERLLRVSGPGGDRSDDRPARVHDRPRHLFGE